LNAGFEAVPGISLISPIIKDSLKLDELVSSLWSESDVYWFGF